MRPSWGPPRIFKTFSWGRFGHQRTPEEEEKAPSSLLRSRARPQNRSTAFLQWIMAPWALPHCKYAVNMAVARGTVNMQSFGLASIYVAPSVDLEASKHFFFSKKQLKLEAFLGRVFPSIEVVTGPRKNAGIRAGDHLRSTR